MRTVFHLLSFLLLGLGALTVALGLAALVFYCMTPPEPPPSLNEGLGLAGFLGWISLGAGGLAFLLGAALMSALRTTRPAHETPEWARQHRRLW